MEADTQAVVDGLFGSDQIKEITGETLRTPVAVPKLAAPAPVAPKPAVKVAAPVEEPAPAPAPAPEVEDEEDDLSAFTFKGVAYWRDAANFCWLNTAGGLGPFAGKYDPVADKIDAKAKEPAVRA